MNAFKKSGGSRFPGLLFSGVVAGALGLALSTSTPSSSSSSTSQNTGYGSSSSDQTGQYGTSSSDTGMSTNAGTGSSSSGSGIGGSGSSTGTSSTSGTGVGSTSTGSYGSGMEGNASSLPPNVSPGWKIRVCSEKTKADQINFKFTMPEKGKMGSKGTAGAEGTGTGGSGDVSSNSASWSRGEATEITLPTELREADKIRIEATPAQKDKKSSVCLIYNDHVAKKLNFDDREVSTVKSTDNGECGC